MAGVAAILCMVSTWAEPVVVTGWMLEGMLGVPIVNLRMVNGAGAAIPFQVDEVTPAGEYVCGQGDSPNQAEGNGLLDPADEIVFLWEDASADSGQQVAATLPNPGIKQTKILIRHGRDVRSVALSTDTALRISTTRYVSYDHASETIRTPFYFAQFVRRRFHFTRAGIMRAAHGYFELAKELRIRIFLKALRFIPIEYNEKNLVCVVKRYKVGPLRLIRRGDFHLNLGLWVKGSHASVNQICYPQAVGVPVFVHAPVRFRRLFSEAFIEMTPVMASQAKAFGFVVPGKEIYISFSEENALDTVIAVAPNNEFFAVHNRVEGFGWLLRAGIPDSLLGGSGFVVQRPSDRGGVAHCGFRLSVRDLPRGDYLITNWVVFAGQGVDGLGAAAKRVVEPAEIWVGGRMTGVNALAYLRSGPR